MNPIDKDKVKQRFTKAKDSYAEHAIAQQQICLHLAEQINLFFPTDVQSIFEIGCGSGTLTQLLLKNIQPQHYIANDLYEDVIELQPKADTLSFCIGDIETITLPYPLDAVVSSSALQWMQDIQQVFKRIHKALKQHGVLAFSIFGERNLHQMKALTGQGLHYLSSAQLCAELKEIGFEILYLHEHDIDVNFTHPLHVLKHLKATGVTANTTDFVWNKQSLAQFYADYAQFAQPQDTGLTVYPLTYHPIYIIARRVI